MTPQISIVMPCYQQVDFLEEAVRSVLDQQITDVELLVMDPGSKDGSRELLEKLQAEFSDRLILCFKADQGQSDALNKGFSKARGRVLGWLNSDDRLRPRALEKVVNQLDIPTPCWAYGRAGMINEHGRPCANMIAYYKNWRSRRFSRLKLLTENFIPQMAVFWNRSMWDQAGGLDCGRHLDMDYDLWLRFAKIADPIVIQEILADFRVHGSAKGSRQTREQLKDAFETARKHAVEFGVLGKMALGLHILYSLRTRILYHWIKP